MVDMLHVGVRRGRVKARRRMVVVRQKKKRRKIYLEVKLPMNGRSYTFPQKLLPRRRYNVFVSQIKKHRKYVVTVTLSHGRQRKSHKIIIRKAHHACHVPIYANPRWVKQVTLSGKKCHILYIYGRT